MKRINFQGRVHGITMVKRLFGDRSKESMFFINIFSEGDLAITCDLIVIRLRPSHESCRRQTNRVLIGVSTKRRDHQFTGEAYPQVTSSRAQLLG